LSNILELFANSKVNHKVKQLLKTVQTFYFVAKAAGGVDSTRQSQTLK